MVRRVAAVIGLLVLGGCSTGYDQDTPTNVIDKARTVGTDAEQRDDRIDNGVPDDADAREQRLEQELRDE